MVSLYLILRHERALPLINAAEKVPSVGHELHAAEAACSVDIGEAVIGREVPLDSKVHSRRNVLAISVTSDDREACWVRCDRSNT
ncbi:hypothetical protein D3C80_757780 [compost metagenome]